MKNDGLTPDDLAAIDGRIKDVYALKVSVEEYIKRCGEDNWRITLQWARKEQDKHDDLMRLRAEVLRCHAVMAADAMTIDNLRNEKKNGDTALKILAVVNADADLLRTEINRLCDCAAADAMTIAKLEADVEARGIEITQEQTFSHTLARVQDATLAMETGIAPEEDAIAMAITAILPDPELAHASLVECTERAQTMGRPITLLEARQIALEILDENEAGRRQAREADFPDTTQGAGRTPEEGA